MAGTELLVEVTDENFTEEIEQHRGIALVDFWAAWCGPCQIIAPIVAQIAEEYEGRVRVAKLDVDANMSTPTRFGVRSIPTLLIFKNGSLVDTVVGAWPKQQLIERLERHLD